MRAIAVLTGSLLLVLACTKADPKLNEKVQSRIAEEGVPAEQVTVQTNDRIVRLEGVVANENELERLEKAARSVPGVLGVDNRLGVQAPVGLTGATIEERGRVRSEVVRRIETAGVGDVDVEVRGQSLILRGRVSASEHDAAIRAATAAAPEMTVIDQLAVAP